MQMLVRLFQLLQEFVDTLGLLVYASGFLDEALRLALSSALL
jgi:hypothetical protein